MTFWDLWINLGADLQHLPILENLTFQGIYKLMDALHYRKAKEDRQKDDGFVDTKRGKVYQKHLKYMNSI